MRRIALLIVAGLVLAACSGGTGPTTTVATTSPTTTVTIPTTTTTPSIADLIENLAQPGTAPLHTLRIGQGGYLLSVEVVADHQGRVWVCDSATVHRNHPGRMGYIGIAIEDDGYYLDAGDLHSKEYFLRESVYLADASCPDGVWQGVRDLTDNSTSPNGGSDQKVPYRIHIM